MIKGLVARKRGRDFARETKSSPLAGLLMIPDFWPTASVHISLNPYRCSPTIRLVGSAKGKVNATAASSGYNRDAGYRDRA